MNECEIWLLEYLRTREFASCDAVREEARKNGFTRGQLKAARKALGVKCWNDSAAQENKKALNWFWYIDKQEESK